MRKIELLQEIKEECGFESINETEEVFDSILEVIKRNALNGKKVNLPGIGNFQLVKRKGREGTVPKSGKHFKTEDKMVVKFKKSKMFSK